ncbi:hypothetical protein ACWIID_24115 [Streptomyces phaeochromogenes]
MPSEQRATGLSARTARVRWALTDERFRRTPLASEVGERPADARGAGQYQLGAAAGALAAVEG